MQRGALALGFVVLAWWSPLFASPLAQRIGEILRWAEASLSAGDGTRTDEALFWARIYLETPVFAAAWPEAERVALTQENTRSYAKLAALRAFPGLLARRDVAALLLSAARGAHRPTPAAFQRAHDEGLACLAAAEALGAVDWDWPVPQGELTLAILRDDCAGVCREAVAEKAQAARAADERDQILRAILRGERLAIYAAHGEPRCACGDGSPAQVAGAPVWIYVAGPSGVLGTVETWTYTFQGHKLLSRRRVTTHQGP